MKRTSALLAGFAILAGTAMTQVATDPSGDGTAPGGVVDLTALYVSESGANVEFALDTVGNIVATDWGKYLFYIETDNAASPLAGATNGNGWGRPINPDGTNLTPKYWLAGWVDGGNGAELYQFTDSGVHSGTGSDWELLDATYDGSPQISISKTTNKVTFVVPKSLLGTPNNVSVVGMASGGGGGDTAVDSVPSHTDPVNWGDTVSMGNPSGPTTVPVELDGYSVE